MSKSLGGRRIHQSKALAVGLVVSLYPGSLYAQTTADTAVEAANDNNKKDAVVAEQSEAPAPAQTVSSEERLEQLSQRLDEQQKLIDAQKAEIDKLAADNAEIKDTANSANDTAQMAMDMSAPEEDLDNDVLKFYGFMDMAFKKLYIPDGSRFSNLVSDSSTFVLGNVNLYIDATPFEGIRALTEVRFSLYPLGSNTTGFDTQDTRVYDVTSATGRNVVPWGGMILERSWIEWNQHDAFRVRVGYFLTPYGIWNVDHGSPTLISSVLPGFWAAEYFPTRQTGVQILGDFYAEDWQFGYRAYVSNGRTPGQVDLDGNKNIGGRLLATYEKDYRMVFGASGFWGNFAQSVQSIETVSPFRVTSTPAVAYEEYGAAADFSFDYKSLRIRSEFVLNNQTYSEGLRPPTSPVSYQRDRTRWDVYGIVAYRLPWLGLEPYVYLEHDRRPTAEDDASTIYSGGLITHFTAGTQLKFQGFYVYFPDTDGFPTASQNSFSGFDLRLVTTY